MLSHSLALKWWLRVCGLGKKIGGGGVGKGTKRARDSASASAIHGPEHSSRDSHTTRDEQAGIKTNYLVERRRDRPEAPPPISGGPESTHSGERVHSGSWTHPAERPPVPHAAAWTTSH